MFAIGKTLIAEGLYFVLDTPAVTELVKHILEELLLSHLTDINLEFWPAALGSSVLFVRVYWIGTYHPGTGERIQERDTCVDWFNDRECRGTDSALTSQVAVTPTPAPTQSNGVGMQQRSNFANVAESDDTNVTVSIVIEDALGRRIGYDLTSGVSFSELPGEYSQTGNEVSLLLRSAYSTAYKVHVYSRVDGTYDLGVRSYGAVSSPAITLNDQPIVADQADGFRLFVPPADDVGYWIEPSAVVPQTTVEIFTGPISEAGSESLTIRYRAATTNRNYFVERRGSLDEGAGWDVMPGGPHNVGTLAITNIGSSSFYRVRSVERNPRLLIYAHLTVSVKRSASATSATRQQLQFRHWGEDRSAAVCRSTWQGTWGRKMREAEPC